MQPLRLAVTADLHWGHRLGREATLALADFLRDRPPDVLVLAGDIGSGSSFADCLQLFAGLPARKVAVPGNHDLWVAPDGPLDSLTTYEQVLPEQSRAAGFHLLDTGPLYLPESDLALVGSVNWYDYSWALDGLRRFHPGEEERLKTKRFTRGRHNDAVFVRWPLDDGAFTQRVAGKLEEHLTEALGRVGKAIVVTHHPGFYGLSFPRPGPPVALDSFLWDAFAGNRTVEMLLDAHADRIPFTFCGHTHRERENTLRGIRGFNVGGDYGWKRLLWLEWPAGTVTAYTFGQPEL